MKIAISGSGWVTPAGSDDDTVWQALLQGNRPPLSFAEDPQSKKRYPYLRVPQEMVDEVARSRRLRRSSAITYFTAAAGLKALENAGLELTPDLAKRVAVVFTVSSGGVIYTRRFYQQIVQEGARAASPLLFPETVYNAPASHLAAILGIDGASYTLVGDGSVGLAGISYASQLLTTTPSIEHVIVVGGEEIDWILCAAYRDWRLTSPGGSLELHQEPPHGTLLAEGAAAVVVSRDGPVAIEAVHDGVPFFRRQSAGKALHRVLSEMEFQEPPQFAVGSANGTFIDAAERGALKQRFQDEPKGWYPKAVLGESLGAGALLQVVAASMALRKNMLPGRSQDPEVPLSCGVVTSIGLNQQASALVLRMEK